MDRQDVCRFIRDNWDELQEEAILQAKAAIENLTAEQICARFLKAGERYGEFDLHAIDVQQELFQEYCDIPSYIALGTLQQK